MPPLPCGAVPHLQRYILNDTETARLSTAAAPGSRIRWWEPTKRAPVPPLQTPSPAPPNVCSNPRPGFDVGPGATRSRAAAGGLHVQSEHECCSACNHSNTKPGVKPGSPNSCVGWTFATDGGVNGVNCWLFSAVVSVTPHRQGRVYGGDSTYVTQLDIFPRYWLRCCYWRHADSNKNPRRPQLRPSDPTNRILLPPVCHHASVCAFVHIPRSFWRLLLSTLCVQQVANEMRRAGTRRCHHHRRNPRLIST
jgi:hypothetical protein